MDQPDIVITLPLWQVSIINAMARFMFFQQTGVSVVDFG
jgi:hypothetical protein